MVFTEKDFLFLKNSLYLKKGSVYTVKNDIPLKKNRKGMCFIYYSKDNRILILESILKWIVESDVKILTSITDSYIKFIHESSVDSFVNIEKSHNKDYITMNLMKYENDLKQAKKDLIYSKRKIVSSTRTLEDVAF